MSDLLVPTRLPDGSFEYHENRDIADRLVNGDSTLGWAGMPGLSLVCNTVLRQWEVWGPCADGVTRRLMTRPGMRLPGIELIKALVAGDSRHVDVIGDVLRADDARDRQVLADGEDRQAETADKLAHALAKDLSLPAPSGKLYPLS